MVRKMCLPEVEIGERMALIHLTTGNATYDNCYRVLADVHGVLTIGVRIKKDTSLDPILSLGHTALLNVYDRMKATKKVGATGDELHALRAMVDIAEDFWNRRPAHELETAVLALRKIREKQLLEKRNAERKDDAVAHRSNA
jgi:hypothetical protein